MPKANRFPKLAVFGCVVAVGVIIGFFVFRPRAPKLQRATPEEIRSVLPKALLEEDLPDYRAQARYVKVLNIFKTFRTRPFRPLEGLTSQTAAGEYDAAKQFWAQYGGTLKQLGQILDSGPLEAPNSDSNDFDSMSRKKAFIKIASAAGMAMAENRQFGPATDILCAAGRLSVEMVRIRGLVIDYINGVGLEASTWRKIHDAVKVPGFPVEDCRRILNAMPMSPKTDETLRVALRAEFQGELLGILGDPIQMCRLINIDDLADNNDPNGSMYGTYEPLATTATIGQLVSEAMDNARKTYADRDVSTIRAVLADAKTLPKRDEPVAESKPNAPASDAAYRDAMNSGRNTVGRAAANLSTFTNDMTELSCRYRALNDCNRIYLASIVYRSSHDGALPASVAEFVPLIGVWPTDPFNGKPLVYDAGKQVVYSVGSNLVDDGGQVTSLDVGLSLKR